jgi:hypothetical protein
LPGQGPTLHSWATKKDIPKPGERPILMFQQPLHTGDYATFSGHLHSGYGAGRVHLIEAGEAAVVHASSNKIKLVTLHKGEPEFFTLIRKSPPPSKGTPRQLRTQGGSWLLINTTPVKSHTKN